MREPPMSMYQQPIVSPHRGQVSSIDNRGLAHLAQLAGAPHAKAAGVLLHAPLGTKVEKGQPLFTIHAESKGAFHYALSLLDQIHPIEVSRQ